MGLAYLASFFSDYWILSNAGARSLAYSGSGAHCDQMNEPAVIPTVVPDSCSSTSMPTLVAPTSLCSMCLFRSLGWVTRTKTRVTGSERHEVCLLCIEHFEHFEGGGRLGGWRSVFL